MGFSLSFFHLSRHGRVVDDVFCAAIDINRTGVWRKVWHISIFREIHTSLSVCACCCSLCVVRGLLEWEFLISFFNQNSETSIVFRWCVVPITNNNMRGREEEKVSMTNNNARMFNRIVKMLVSFSNSFTCEPRFDLEFESIQSFYANIKVSASSFDSTRKCLFSLLQYSFGL